MSITAAVQSRAHRARRAGRERQQCLGRPPWVRAIRDRFDFINGLWTQSIIRFDALRQKGMLTRRRRRREPGRSDAAFSAVLAVVLLIATLWATASSGLRVATSSIARGLCSGAGSRVPASRCRVNEGPLDWLARARTAAPASAAALGGLVQDYVALRYGANEPVPERVRVFTRCGAAFSRRKGGLTHRAQRRRAIERLIVSAGRD